MRRNISRRSNMFRRSSMRRDKYKEVARLLRQVARMLGKRRLHLESTKEIVKRLKNLPEKAEWVFSQGIFDADNVVRVAHLEIGDFDVYWFLVYDHEDGKFRLMIQEGAHYDDTDAGPWDEDEDLRKIVEQALSYAKDDSENFVEDQW